MTSKRKKRGATDVDDTPVLAKVPEKLASPFRDALRGVKPAAAPTTTSAKRAPAPPPTAARGPRTAGDERRALTMAYSGVARLGGGARRVTGLEAPRERSDHAGSAAPSATTGDETADYEHLLRQDDAAARARLGALVGGGVRIQVSRDEDGRVLGQRAGADASVVRRVQKGQVSPDATLDLHGARAADAEARVVRFVRTEHRRGGRCLLVVHGKGMHSEAGVAVLDDVALRALTEGGAAPLVLALATAPTRLGGSGALVVQLVDRL